MSVKIVEIEICRPFKYLWLKYLTGVDLRHHCAKSLLGYYSKQINAKSTPVVPLVLDEAKASYFYLCGVSQPYNWHNNFHLAFKEQEGSIIEVCRQGIKIKIENAREIPINMDDIDFSDKNANNPAYRTCRNWQFAWTLSKILGNSGN